jgi:hypothetical protein
MPSPFGVRNLALDFGPGTPPKAEVGVAAFSSSFFGHRCSPCGIVMQGSPQGFLPKTRPSAVCVLVSLNTRTRGSPGPDRPLRPGDGMARRHQGEPWERPASGPNPGPRFGPKGPQPASAGRMEPLRRDRTPPPQASRHSTRRCLDGTAPMCAADSRKPPRIRTVGTVAGVARRAVSSPVSEPNSLS